MSVKSAHKATLKAGMERMIGNESSWSAHKGRRCLQACFYCRRDRLGLRSGIRWLRKMPDSLRHYDKQMKDIKPIIALKALGTHLKNRLPFFRAKV